MSIHQDRFNSLSELERLAELTKQPHLLAQIAAPEWPLAILACSLNLAPQVEQEAHVRSVYRVFQSHCPTLVRAKSLVMLVNFLTKQQGKAWRALLAYALEDEDAHIRRQAAGFIATLTPEAEESRGGEGALQGLSCLVERLLSEPNAPTSLLDALMGVADRRVAPYLEPLLEQLPQEEIERHIAALSASPSQLCFDWLCEALARYPETLREPVLSCLIRSVSGHDEVVDVIQPMPLWKFRQSAVQPLHQWTRREYAERMRHALSPHVDEGSLDDWQSRFIQA